MSPDPLTGFCFTSDIFPAHSAPFLHLSAPFLHLSAPFLSFSTHYSASAPVPTFFPRFRHLSQVGFSYPTIPFCPHCPISFVPLPPLFLYLHSPLFSSPLSSHPFVSFPLSFIPLSPQSFVLPHCFPYCVLFLQYLSIVLPLFYCPLPLSYCSFLLSYCHLLYIVLTSIYTVDSSP